MQKELAAILNQRSQDMLTANNWNVVQYAVLTHMMAQVSGLKVGELVHVIADCHIYDRHIPAVKAMLELDGYEAPKFSMDESIADFYAFTKDSFRLENSSFPTGVRMLFWARTLMWCRMPSGRPLWMAVRPLWPIPWEISSAPRANRISS